MRKRNNIKEENNERTVIKKTNDGGYQRSKIFEDQYGRQKPEEMSERRNCFQGTYVTIYPF